MQKATTAEADLFEIDDIFPEELSAPTTTSRESSAEKQPPVFTSRHRATCPDGILFFDLETIPDYSRESQFDLPPLPTIGPRTPAENMLSIEELRSASLDEVRQVVRSKRPEDGYLAALEAAERSDKKPRKGLFDLIDEIRGESNATAIAQEERRKIMSLTPEMNRIVSFGWAWESDPVQASVFGAGDATKDFDTYEGSVLKKFWELAGRAKLIVGFNVLGFDLPTIFTRSALLGVKPTRRIDLKPWGGDVCDLMAVRWPKSGATKLKSFAKRLGFAIPAGDTDGSQVEELWRTDPLRLGDYNRSDVSLTRELFLFGKGFWW